MGDLQAPTVFTCGYQGRSLDELLRELRALGVQVIVDVRDHAASRRPDFGKTRLSMRVEQAKLKYVHMPALGVPAEIRKGSGGRAEALSWYAERLAGNPPEELHQLADVVRSQTVVLLCYEASAADCHRHVLADAIVSDVEGTVRHL